MKNLAPQIIRQRLLMEGYYKINVNKDIINTFYKELTAKLNLRMYAEPIIHHPEEQGKEVNQGYDCFVPLIDSGIYLGIWANENFLSMVIYTCKRFNVKEAIKITKEFWKIDKIVKHSF